VLNATTKPATKAKTNINLLLFRGSVNPTFSYTVYLESPVISKQNPVVLDAIFQLLGVVNGLAKY